MTKITQASLFELWEEFILDDCCDKKQSQNILNLIRKIPKIYVNRILLIIKYYLVSINKKYILSSFVLEIFNYVKVENSSHNIKVMHILYDLCRDYWNILVTYGHNSTPVCYYNHFFDLYDNEKNYLEREIILEENFEPLPMKINSPKLLELDLGSIL